MLPRHALHLDARAGASPHAAHAHVLLIGVDGEVAVETAAGETRGRAVLVAPDVVHRSRSRGPSLALLLDAERARPHASQRGATALAPGAILDTVHALRTELERPDSLRAAAPELVRAIGGAAPARLDPRIDAALARLRAEGDRVPLAALARAAGLSAGHFSDLFAREVGIPLRRWQVWARVVRAMVSTAPTLVERAADGGFADQAHMARSFRRFLGHPATALLRRPRAIDLDDQARSSARPAARDTTGA